MTVKTTRRGLFAAAAAFVGAGRLVATKPARALAPEAPTGGPLATWQLHFRLLLRRALGERGLDSSLWSIEFDYDAARMSDRVVVSSTAYRDGVRTYSAAAIYREGDVGFGLPANQETADMLVDSLAVTIEEGW